MGNGWDFFSGRPQCWRRDLSRVLYNGRQERKDGGRAIGGLRITRIWGYGAWKRVSQITLAGFGGWQRGWRIAAWIRNPNVRRITVYQICEGRGLKRPATNADGPTRSIPGRGASILICGRSVVNGIVVKEGFFTRCRKPVPNGGPRVLNLFFSDRDHAGELRVIFFSHHHNGYRTVRVRLRRPTEGSVPGE